MKAKERLTILILKRWGYSHVLIEPARNVVGGSSYNARLLRNQSAFELLDPNLACHLF